MRTTIWALSGSIPELGSGKRLTVIFAHRHQVNHAA
jgi:hypothetical protein